MRRKTNVAAVGFTARISEQDQLDLAEILPMSGGKRWLIETALREFLDLCEKDARLVSFVNDQVMQMREDGRPAEKLVDFLPRVKTDLYMRFNRIFPEKGATTWFIRRFIELYLQDNIGKEPRESQVKVIVRHRMLEQ